MPETARILPFRSRGRREILSPDESAKVANDYLACPAGEIKEEEGRLSQPDILFSIAKLLRERVESEPADSFERAASLHSWISSTKSIGLFDERDYLLGEFSLIVAKSARLLGRFSEAERWLDKSDAGYRHTINPAPSLAHSAFERLALRFASGRYDEILDLLPSVSLSFERLGLEVELAKCSYLEAMALKATGKPEESIRLLAQLERNEGLRKNASLYGQVLIQVGDHYASRGDFDLAASTYEKAMPVVLAGSRPVAIGELKWAIGDVYRAQGALTKAVESYRSAKEEYEHLGSRSFIVQLNLVIADVLLAQNRSREAEWEILAALPVIEEEKMVPEGFAAVSLLRESVNRRKTDSGALLELRRHLRSKN